MCAHMIRDETVCATLRNTGRKLGSWMGKFFNPNSRPPRKSIPTETRYLAQKTVSTLLKMWSLNADKKSYLKRLKNNPNWPSHFTPFCHFWRLVSHRRRNHPCEILSRLTVDQRVSRLWLPKMGGFPRTLIVALTTLLRTNVLHCDANCWGLCRPTVFRRNVFFWNDCCRPIVCRPKNNSPKRLSPNWFFAQPSATQFYYA